ncbi:MAG: hypothetical protein NC253_02440 [Ruminococcus sp.]|nr:hypothetical protein [Ruminococcus sp.]MCM1382307.1 hypothetical protein [Muribaculaceae bacterium]MCM1478705.1 hypothetical protein [Muribaculaceae bacterium]
MSPFNFNVVMDGKKSLRRWTAYTAAAFVLTAVFTAGFLTVYVNSYNVMHTEPMTVIEFRDDGVVLLNRYYEYKK